MDPRLYKAAAEGDIDALKNITEGRDLTATPNKNTVLHIHITAQMVSINFVNGILNMFPSLLLQANAKGDTPLHIAARYGHYNIIEVLIERAKALHEEPEGGVRAARQMLRMTNKEKNTALHEAVRFNHIFVVHLLIEEDPDFSYSANDVGETPLYLAATRGFHLSVVLILRNCTSPAHGGPNAKTALHAAVICNVEAMIERILEWKGALTKEADSKGWTPLHYAAHLGHLSTVRLLLKYDKSVAYFADRSDKMTALHIAAGRGHRDIMKEFISCCPDCCELVDWRGWNVLHFAVESGDEEAVQVVLENSLLSNLINEKDNRGYTPLHHLATSLCYIPALINHPKVDKMALNNEGKSPLDISLANENGSEMKELIVRDLKTVGSRAGRNDKDDGGKGNDKDKDDGGRGNNKDDLLTELKKAKTKTNLKVATLIATVAFAAGYNISDTRLDQGTEILTRKAAFRAFVITNMIAMVLSTSVVFIHLFLALVVDKIKFFWCFVLASSLIIFAATGTMVVAFTTGLYTVLEHPSSGLAIATCVSACCCFFLCYYLFAKPISSEIRKAWKELSEQNAST